MAAGRAAMGWNDPECDDLDTLNRFRILTASKPRWRNWQTHYFEVVAPQGVQVQILSWAFREGDPKWVAFFIFESPQAGDVLIPFAMMRQFPGASGFFNSHWPI
jgi:hypothetical protein